MPDNEEDQEEKWIEDKIEENEENIEFPIEYNITASPNDFNVMTLHSFIESGVIEIPSFQRNFVWDRKRSSKLIESIAMGLPIPQLFLFEEEKNKFQVIDGQQRLMTIYYFIKKRFPKLEKRSELREIFDKEGKIPQEIISNNEFFEDFVLKLPERLLGEGNRLNNSDYDNLPTDIGQSFNLRPIRTMIIRQHEPKDNSSKFEIFYRLNTGGMNLTPQEIRTSLYFSEFYKRLYRLNLEPKWRHLINRDKPDLHMRDVEIILRGFAMLINGNTYQPSMVRFLNNFSEQCKKMKKEEIIYLENIFKKFLEKSENLILRAYLSNRVKFNVSLYESVFIVSCEDAYRDKNLNIKEISSEKIETLRKNTEFINASLSQTTSKKNVENRLRIAKEILN